MSSPFRSGLSNYVDDRDDTNYHCKEENSKIVVYKKREQSKKSAKIHELFSCKADLQTCLYGKKFTHEYCTNSCANIPVCAIVNMCGFEYQNKLVLYLNFYTIVFLKIKKFLSTEERNSLFLYLSLRVLCRKLL